MKVKVMKRNKIINKVSILLLVLFYNACSVPNLGRLTEVKSLPVAYSNSNDLVNSATIKWRLFFKDTFLVTLIDSALKNNQELNIVLQEIHIARNEIKVRKGEYLPFVYGNAGAGADKVGRYTSKGANDANTDIMPGKVFPEPLGDYLFSAKATWELDVWKKLRNARKSAVYKFLATEEGKNFMVTNLVSEIAKAYYELRALDNQLSILNSNIDIQKNALEIVKLEKISAKVTELAVKKFEAEVLKNQSRVYYIQQAIVETENKINFLIGRYPQPVSRDTTKFIEVQPDSILSGIPNQLLVNRPDIRQAEMNLLSAKVDVKVARANFFPSVRLTAGLGYEAFNPKFLLSSPESVLYNLAGDMIAPLVNRNAIKASYYTANSKQIQAVYNYEQTVLKAYIEVVNQLSKIRNLNTSYELKVKQVQALTLSIDISTILFRSARADYMEVLMTQRDALDARFELIDTKLQQMTAAVQMYTALGGGWR